MGKTWDYIFCVVGTEGLNTPYFNVQEYCMRF
jgi:hypothetical protein